MSLMRSFVPWLVAPVDAITLVGFRIVFGFLLTAEAAGRILLGWTVDLFIEPPRTLTLPGCEWLQPLGGTGMMWLEITMMVTGLAIMAGIFYRLALAAHLVMWVYVFVLQTVHFNNHHYLMALLLAFMLVAPATVAGTYAHRRGARLALSTVPRWTSLIFILQQAIVYAYATVAKLQADWIAGRPFRVWLPPQADRPLIGPLLQHESLPVFLAWGGIAFDGCIVPALLWSRTRPFAFMAAIFFHGFNAVVFQVGVFPYLALALMAFFFPAATLRRRLGKLAAIVPAPDAQALAVRPPVTRGTRVLLACLACHFVLQVLLPLRPWLYEGNPHWTENGHRFSWMMMARIKIGHIVFELHDPESGKRWRVTPDQRYGPAVARHVATSPERIWQMAQWLAEEARAAGSPRVQVFARSMVSLNGRPAQPLVDPHVDLAAEPWPLFGPVPFIVPLAPLE